MSKCRFKGSCYHKYDGDCEGPCACVHQKEKLNTRSILVGPDQNGLWHTAPNEDYISPRTGKKMAEIREPLKL